MKTAKILKFFRGYGKEAVSKEEIQDIIRNRINVQVCLANLFVLKPTCLFPEERLTTKIGLIDSDVDGEIDMFKKVFNRFSFSKLTDESMFCQVSDVDPFIINTFFELRAGGDINKWLEHFTLREFKDDCKGIVYDKFKYKADKHVKDVTLVEKVEAMRSDPYFKYFLDKEINCFGGKITVPGFTLQEIEEDEDIFALSQMVDSLSVEIIDGYKFLNWMS